MTEHAVQAVHRVFDLPPPERVLLWSMRVWVQGQRQEMCVRQDLMKGLSRFGIAAGPC